SEVEFADEGLHQRATGRRFGRFPVGPAGEGKKALFLEILLEHVEAVGDQRERAVAIAHLLEERQRLRRVSQGDGRHRERNRRARRILRGNAGVDQRVRRLYAAGDRERAEARGRGAQQVLESLVRGGELQDVAQITDVRFAVHAEEADRGGNRRLRRPRRGALDGRERLE